MNTTRKTKANECSILRCFINKRQVSQTELMDISHLSRSKLKHQLDFLTMKGILCSEHNGCRECDTSYRLNPEYGCFIIVNLFYGYVHIAATDFGGTQLTEKTMAYSYGNSREKLLELISHINGFLKEQLPAGKRVISILLNSYGKIEPQQGSNRSLFTFLDGPLAEFLGVQLGYKVYVENITRSMLRGEVVKGVLAGKQNAVFINLDWSLSASLLVNGEVMDGHSGFAGELGHLVSFNNEIICHCGKKGCLNTEVSGYALHRELLERLDNNEMSILQNKYVQEKTLTLHDITTAINQQDSLCLELLDEMARKLGKEMVNLMNLLNPEVIVIGGKLAETKDYLLPPAKISIKRYSLRMVNRELKLYCSVLGNSGCTEGGYSFCFANFADTMNLNE